MPRPLIFRNGAVIASASLIEDGAVLVRDGRIAQIGPRITLGECPDAEPIDAEGGFISPGFVDIHVHGGGGSDFMDGTRQAVVTACQTHARHGTTTIFPTTTTGSREQIDAMMFACRVVQSDGAAANGARIAGVHFYGPYFAPDKVGCHSQGGRRDPDPIEYLRHLDSGLVRVATCAAELPGSSDFYRAATERGCLATCGHSNASWGEMRNAFDAGMRHVDHFWCAMSSVQSIRARFGTPSQGSMEQFVLMETRMSTEVIADGCHLAPELLEFAFRMIGPERLCLVTDANRGVDMAPGDFRFGPDSDGEWFTSDGRVGFQRSGGLASSVRGMDFMVREMVRSTSCGIVAAVRMASLTPAERTGISSEVGSLAPGKRADVVLLDRDLAVRRVFLAEGEFGPLDSTNRSLNETQHAPGC